MNAMLNPRHCVAACAAAGSILHASAGHTVWCTTADNVHPNTRPRNPAGRDGQFSEDDVRKNDGTDGRPLWVIFRGSVHDVTEFQHRHPGGKYILQAAGGDVEPFWNKWAYHYDRTKVKEALQETRIGSLHPRPSGLPHGVEAGKGVEELYRTEPARDPSLLKELIARPYTGESRPAALLSYLTPAAALYVRNHAPVPMNLKAKTHEISFGISSCEECSEEKSVTLPELLQQHPAHKVVSVLQCAGNRAAHDMEATGVNGFKDTPYEVIKCGMMGNVMWEGVLLSSVLRNIYPVQCAAETSSEESVWHVNFIGAEGYETSVPLSYILDTSNQCILATKMNGHALTADHGYPVRVVMPGLVGARNVKWLESVFLSRQVSKAPWSAAYYLNRDGVDIQGMPMQSLILRPSGEYESVLLYDESLHVEGVSYSGGTGATIAKVEISIDDGKTWTEAHLHTAEMDSSVRNGRSFGWVRFEADVNVSATSNTAGKPLSVCCRSTDSNGNIQPKVSEKHRGYIYNGWHYVRINIESMS